MGYALGALGGTRTPTMLLTATSRQRVYQFRHERFERTARDLPPDRINGADVTNRGWADKACRRSDQGGRFPIAGRRISGYPQFSAAFA
jgi:hypothetical protein